MSCFHPISIKDVLTGYPVSVPCNKCIGCLSDKRKSWSYRITEELKSCDKSYFLTLTYDDNHVPRNENGQMIVFRKDVTDFMKRLRKNNPLFRFRYFGVSEYGDAFKRPHYHIIIFVNYTKELHEKSKHEKTELLSYNKTRQMFCDAWSLRGDSFGFILLREVKNADIKYTAKYTIKEIDDNYPAKTFNMMSTKPFIGYAYVDKMRHWHLLNNAVYYPNGSYKSKLPRIYYTKIFPEDWRRSRTYLNERHALDVDKIIMFFHARERGLSGFTYIGDCDIRPKDYDKYRKKDLFKYDFVDLDDFSKNSFYEPDMLTKHPVEYYEDYLSKLHDDEVKERQMLKKYRQNRKFKSERNERLASINQIKRSRL